MSKITEMLRGIECSLLDNDGKCCQMPLTTLKDIVRCLESLEELVNVDYERSELLTHLLNGWLEEGETIELQMGLYDESGETITTSFKVPRKWLEDFVVPGISNTITEFMEEYTTEEAENIYSNAIIDGVLID